MIRFNCDKLDRNVEQDMNSVHFSSAIFGQAKTDIPIAIIYQLVDDECDAVLIRTDEVAFFMTNELGRKIISEWEAKWNGTEELDQYLDAQLAELRKGEL